MDNSRYIIAMYVRNNTYSKKKYVWDTDDVERGGRDSLLDRSHNYYYTKEQAESWLELILNYVNERIMSGYTHTCYGWLWYAEMYFEIEKVPPEYLV